MSLNEILLMLSKEFNIPFLELKKVYSPFEIFDLYLKSLGIQGYTQQIVTAFRCIFHIVP